MATGAGKTYTACAFGHRLLAGGVHGYFTHMWMQTIQSRLEAYAPATAQKNINLEALHNVAVPLLPTEEQRQIADRFRGSLEAVRDCVETVALEKDRDALHQSILKAAFDGRLVPQEPANEPASALLARFLTGNLGTATRRRWARAEERLSQSSLPDLTRQFEDPRVGPAGDG